MYHPKSRSFCGKQGPEDKKKKDIAGIALKRVAQKEEAKEIAEISIYEEAVEVDWTDHSPMVKATSATIRLGLNRLHMQAVWLY